jgi:hypothetical protein
MQCYANICRYELAPAPIDALLNATVPPRKNITVPYQYNRAILFDSSYFHESGHDLRFKPGYTNRRINVTLLFGAREHLVRRGAPATQPSSCT